MRMWYAHALVLAISGAAFGQTQPITQTSVPRQSGEKAAGATTLLNQKILEVSFTDMPLDQVVEWLQGMTNVNIVPRWQTLIDAGISREKPITLNAKNLRLSQILWLIMNEAGGSDIKLAYRASGNLLVLSTADDLGHEMLVRVYDVADLLVRFPKFRDSPQIDIQNTQNAGAGTAFSTGGGTTTEDQPEAGAGQAGQVDPDLQTLMELIQQTIQPDSWTRNYGLGTISAWRTQIVVRNNIRVHQELGGPIRDGE